MPFGPDLSGVGDDLSWHTITLQKAELKAWEVLNSDKVRTLELKLDEAIKELFDQARILHQEHYDA